MAEKYEAVGTGIEEMTTAQNYETNSVKDVLGNTRVRATKGNKTISVTPVTINSDYKFAKFIDTAIERQYELSQLVKEFLFVKMYKKVGTTASAAKLVAWKQKAVVVPDDWAIGNADLQAGVTINLTGEATYGTVDFNATGDKFTAETSEPTSSQIHYTEGDAKRSDFVMYYIYEE